VLPNHPDFESVTKEDFSEIKLRSQNERRTQKAPDISGLERFKSLGPPPQKKAHLVMPSLYFVAFPAIS
jgi:hypothetical protein